MARQSLAVCIDVQDENVVVVVAVKSQPVIVDLLVVQDCAPCPLRPGAAVTKHPTKTSRTVEDAVQEDVWEDVWEDVFDSVD